jgi:Peptidase_C39 like family
MNADAHATSLGIRAARGALMTLSVLGLLPARSLAHATAPQDQFWTVLAPAMTPSAGWRLHGVALDGAGMLRLAPSPTPLPCVRADVDGGVASYDPAAGLCSGRDPYRPGGYHGRPYYNGARFRYGTLLAPPHAAGPFAHAIASWVAATPPGTWLEAHLRVLLETGVWTRWYALPIWASGTQSVRRHSIDGQGGAATVATDTLALRRGRVATAYQLAVTLFAAGAASPSLRRLSLGLSRAVPDAPGPASASSAWGRDVPVPARSDMLAHYRGNAYGGGGDVWCSPTSTSMILAYWAQVLGRADLDESVPQAAGGTYDWTYQGTGNWPFNVAHAASFAGMDGFVARFPALAALEPWIVARVPVALSIAYGPGALPGAPVPASAGHLVVLRGFDRAGNPIVNDPAGPTDATVRRIYPRAALERAWLSGSGGTTYVIYPQGWPVPQPLT